ncbi:c-type cytochrome biogenesis protein CcsB [Ornithinimicrobium sediminis]|uniref:c-type cytochrome biogenesis protein CcsB n=1 Tax=Ornithinimicrobium sediminis TaxID=2904603 RepID=UPI001E592725|nr:c-type cytochrome biogenesis protein CcsB [Ornithinimicrobium sediminis]MCE0485756.1 c-type cytochrome biogenesis protein CcsB [Ornithinimicrobium sediminis]
MTDETLAAASDIGVWATIAVLAVAMVAFALHLAVNASRSGASTHRADREGTTVGAQAEGGGAAVATVSPPDTGGAPSSRRWGVTGLQLTLLAAFLVSVAAVLRGVSVNRAPLGNMYEFAVVTCAFVLVIYGVWALRRDLLWLGLFVVTPVLLTLGVAMVAWYTEASQLLPALNSIWLVIHVTVATATVGLFIIGFATAVLYLLRDRAEERAADGAVTGWLAALPRAAVLERLTYGLHIVAFPLWTFTLVAGAIWAEQAWGRYWGWDPKEVWTFVIWAVYAAYLHARATTGWTTRRSTWLAIAGFACVVINYTVVNLFFVGFHSYSGV